MKTCPCPCGCNASANTTEELESVFGWRGKLIQSWCRGCRGGKHTGDSIPSKTYQFNVNINAIFQIIIDNILLDNFKTKSFFSEIPKFDESGKFISNIKRYELAKQYLLERNRKFIEDFLESFKTDDSLVSDEQIIKLFEMYNFDIIKAEENSFFSFRISTPLRSGESQQEWKSKQNIVVILTRLNGTITETFIKSVNAKIHSSVAIIISAVDENPLSFSYDTDKICFIGKNLLHFLLLYRIGKVNLRRSNHDGTLVIYGFVDAMNIV